MRGDVIILCFIATLVVALRVDYATLCGENVIGYASRFANLRALGGKRSEKTYIKKGEKHNYLRAIIYHRK